MFVEILERIINHLGAAINTVDKEPKPSRINPPLCRADDEAEMLPLFEEDFNIDYLDEIPF